MSSITLSSGAAFDLVAEITRRGGTVVLHTRGRSMAPTIRDGDRVTIGPFDPGRAHPGQIVAIGGRRPRVHRVLRVEHGDGWIVTRGDACELCDSPSPLRDVVGRVVRVDRSLGAGIVATLRSLARRVVRPRRVAGTA